MKKIDRRAFLATTGLAAGAAALPLNTINAKSYIDGSDVIKVGLIGCGGRGTGAAAQALSSKQNIQIVAMADAFEDRLEKCYKALTDEEFTDWSTGKVIDMRAKVSVTAESKFVGFDAYKKVIEMCDVVLIATPPGFRPIHFEAAVEAGKHVFMEKPLAVDGPGVRKVLAAAEIAKSKKLNVVVGLQRHYQDIYLKWVDMLHGGAIGDIRTARVYWNGAGVWVRPRTPEQTEMEYQMRNWYYFNWLCGDHINEQHIHNLDVGNWVMKDYPAQVSGMGGRQVRTGKDHGEIYDHHFLEYEYANGARMFSQCRHIKGTQNRVSEAFEGTNGSAPAPGKIMTPSGYALLDYDKKGDRNPYQVEHDELFAAIAKGEYKFEDATNGAKATLTAVMGRMASYTGQVVTWDDALNSQQDLSPSSYAWDANPPVMPNADGYYPIAMPGKTKIV
ncbi:MAG: myo-inositol 2-dehydrogenase/D-chiro-inositol 1-dehydrogenase [Saprospiraceae bacterium]|jgi:myo-inositol 2-dehydrogenase/D-chiro-inositol 1-dehydrogenase